MKQSATDDEILAIASIPMQKWKDIYDFESALEIGTIFPELNKPFYITDTPIVKTTDSQSSKDKLLFQIDCISFALNDLTLFLDTHPDDFEALKVYCENHTKRKDLMTEFSNLYYPLTQDCTIQNSINKQHFCWTEGSMPWEGVSI